MVPREFIREIQEEITLFDLFLLASVPVVLSLVFLLPQQIQSSLILDYQNPSVFNMFSSAYVHRGFDHYAGNLVSYLLLVVPGYLLSILGGERKAFRYTFGFFVLLLPFLLPSINMVVVTPDSGAGFSGVNGAFLGFLAVALFAFLRNQASEEFKVSYATSLFVVAAGIIAWIYTGLSLLTVGVFAAAVFLILFDVYRIGVTELKKALIDLFNSEGYFELVVIGLLLFLITPTVMFPRNLSQNGTVVNILSHYLGLTFGFFAPYLYLSYRKPE